GTTENFLKRFNVKELGDLPDYEALLERIKTIREEEDAQNQDTLFRDVENIEFNEELPDYLKGEDFVKIEADDDEAV
ncbi:MAG: hypothetical protein J6K97_03250, partial [Clostridia bacterium]|nr:hypothetical protein [Clostridia bacterium]